MSASSNVLDCASIQSEITNLVQLKLTGKSADPVGFVDDLFRIAAAAGELHCCLAGDRGFRFLLNGQTQPFDVLVDRAHAKLRMICARLAKMVSETDGQEFLVYGGEGRVTLPLPGANAQTGGPGEQRYQVRHQNSNAAPIEFTITAL